MPSQIQKHHTCKNEDTSDSSICSRISPMLSNASTTNETLYKDYKELPFLKYFKEKGLNSNNDCENNLKKDYIFRGINFKNNKIVKILNEFDYSENSPWHEFINSKPLGILTFLVKNDVYCEYITPNAAGCLFQCIIEYLRILCSFLVPLVLVKNFPINKKSNYKQSISPDQFLQSLITAYEKDFVHLPFYNYSNTDSTSAAEYTQKKLGEFLNNTIIIKIFRKTYKSYQEQYYKNQNFEIYNSKCFSINQKIQSTSKKVIHHFNLADPLIPKLINSSKSLSTTKINSNLNISNKETNSEINKRKDKKYKNRFYINFNKNLEHLDFQIIRLCACHYLISLIRQSSIHMVYCWRSTLCIQDILYAASSLASRYRPLNCCDLFI